MKETDIKRFQSCYEAYGKKLLHLAVNQLGSWTEAEDVVQEVFIKWMEHRDFRDGEHEKRWFIRVTVNLCRNIQKSGRKRYEIPLEDFYPAKTILTEEKLDVAEAILSLDGDTATIVYLHYYGGYSVREIGQILHMGSSAVKMRLSRGRQQLKEKLEVRI